VASSSTRAAVLPTDDAEPVLDSELSDDGSLVGSSLLPVLCGACGDLRRTLQRAKIDLRSAEFLRELSELLALVFGEEGVLLLNPHCPSSAERLG